MNQSHKTAMTRKTPSVPMRRLFDAGLLTGHLLDYGCGKGFDADRYNMDKYDPHFFRTWPNHTYDTVVCNYVLNVVDESTQSEIVSDLLDFMRPGGKAYVTVRRDLPKDGAPGRGCYQRNVKLLEGPCVKVLWETASYCTYVIG